MLRCGSAFLPKIRKNLKEAAVCCRISILKRIKRGRRSMKKTNAARLLDRLGIDYELLEYRVDEQDLSAEHVAQELDLPAEQVFKTIVLRGDKTGVFVCCRSE